MHDIRRAAAALALLTTLGAHAAAVDSRVAAQPGLATSAPAPRAPESRTNAPWPADLPTHHATALLLLAGIGLLGLRANRNRE